MPLLVLLPVYLRLERGHRLEAAARASRSASCCSCCSRRSRAAALLGLGVGLLVLALPYRRFVCARARCSRRSRASRSLLAYVLYSRWHYFSVVLRSRVQTGGASSSAHFAVYDFIPQIIHSHPLLGLGLNNFSVYYEFVTGKTNWGPHSFWVALDRRDGARRPAALRRLPALRLPAAARGAAARPRARRGGDRARACARSRGG